MSGRTPGWVVAAAHKDVRLVGHYHFVVDVAFAFGDARLASAALDETVESS